ncbi:hypothetical protein E2562_004000 [Oryza meyeriana var. granulata]|uniref:Uncharacterized protein n=1 Tax=Oryza meyeriana var. granulata TaxID=110450 RepID=A0A6G1BI82_9ORYZ|nr:hypothetical protein E2562_004000 [Oryza meyeriana var. granulata]
MASTSLDHKRLRRRLSLAATGEGAAAGKRLRAGCSAEAATDPPTSPRWRLLQQSVLVVLFLRRA